MLWNAIAICDMFKTSWQTGKVLMKEDLEKSMQGPIIPFGALGEYLAISERGRRSENSSIRKESITMDLSRICFDRGRIWEGDILIADIEELEMLDASGKYPRRLNANEVQISQKKKRICISCCRWFSKMIRKRLRIPRTRNIPQKTECKRSPDIPKRWRISISCGRWFSKIIRKRIRIPRKHSETGIIRKERERVSAENLIAIGNSFNLKNQKMTQKFIMTFGPFKEISFIVVILKREIKTMCLEKSHSLFH